jgi:hypothetical protein
MHIDIDGGSTYVLKYVDDRHQYKTTADFEERCRLKAES